MPRNNGGGAGAGSIGPNLLAWYSHAKRDLPWRRTLDPYAIWLSEVMLQQTRVETVVPYYLRFIGRFPSVLELARAPLDEVLTLWAGLGYYSRARHLHAAARCVASSPGRQFPQSAEELRTLPGVGDYTAAAIASIAFDEPVAVVDGNVKRVLARLFAISEPIDATGTASRLREFAQSLVPSERPGDFNQAMMELGATVCLPRAPRCDGCPVRACCQAAEHGIADGLPVRSRQPKVTRATAVAGVVFRREKWLMVRRPDAGLLGGMWELPGEEFERGRPSAARLATCLSRDFGLQASVGRRCGVVEHVFTHRIMRVHVYGTELEGGRPTPRRHTDARWINAADLVQIAVSSLARKTLATAGLLSAV